MKHIVHYAISFPIIKKSLFYIYVVQYMKSDCLEVYVW